MEKNKFGCPLVAAVSTGSRRAVASFMAVRVEVFGDDEDRNLLEDFEKSSFTKSDDSAIVQANTSIMSCLADAGDPIIFRFALRSPELMATINSKDYEGRTPLSYAAEAGNIEVFNILLSCGNMDLDQQEKPYDFTPLLYACRN
jgi:ankyrin repeat protein